MDVPNFIENNMLLSLPWQFASSNTSYAVVKEWPILCMACSALHYFNHYSSLKFFKTFVKAVFLHEESRKKKTSVLSKHFVVFFFPFNLLGRTVPWSILAHVIAVFISFLEVPNSPFTNKKKR